MARTKDQGRRRRLLIDATIAVIAEKGPAAVTARAIAGRAGVSPATVIYYYPQMDDLVAAVRDDAVERFCVQRERIADLGPDARSALVRLVAEGLPTGSHDALITAIVQLLAVGRQDERHARHVTEFWLRQVDLFQRVVERGAEEGVFAPALPARRVAEHVVAFEDSYGIHIISGNRAVTRASALRLIHDYAEAVLDCRLPEQAAATGP
ncbi:AcrR family transcriptional regulator [Spinactinospora alkalitolerans]|uniref:AcrR family transcriptional regulator n=1 Tax=Spinactinospora alkalitolerans TaxID=687207 RepID=A0A852U8M9_9ACTN|nr:TetR/AcrR family transcriptional regulator [Spinactinospora alkalitolerans]NYE50280.1 AcrR family transcriptional regulator [Spinactinospora alkalitolerans]